MMMLLACLAIFIVLCIAEIGWRRGIMDNEFGRKFVHIIVGSFVAFWPLFLSWNEIILLSIAFVVVVSVSKAFKIFRSIHSVQRPTYGELYFAVAVGLLAYLTHDGWIYMAALLHMSLADGLAAVVGMKYGKSNQYRILGYAKSLAGTMTFFVSSVVILSLYSYNSDVILGVISIIGIALFAALLENVSTRGLDNITVPMWVAAMLSRIS